MAAETRFYAARMGFTRCFRDEADATYVLRRALSSVSERGTALRLLVDLDDATRRALFPALVEAACMGHRYVAPARQVILAIDPRWLAEHVPSEVDRILNSSLDYGVWRRLAELLQAVQSPYLARIVERAAVSNDLDIREVAQDFG